MIMLVTGGARSGKSKYAEEMIGSVLGQKLYIATAIAFDEEMKDRIRKHKESRPEDWTTYEGFVGLADVVLTMGIEHEGILLDCVTLWLTNLLFEFLGEADIESLDSEAINALEEQIMKEVVAFVEALRTIEVNAENDKTFVLVTNEIGMGLVPESKLSRVFRDIQGRVNQYIGKNSDHVTLCVCGIPMNIK